MQTGARQREAQTSRAEPNYVVQCIQDKDFWYWDGNVILLLGNTAFKLHASRLASYCGYFRDLFAPGGFTGVALAGEAEGCSIYYVPPELSTGSFKHLLRALESPLCVYSIRNDK